MGCFPWIMALLVLVTMATGVKGWPAPNIIILLADDVAWGDYEVHDSEMATPALTALAQRGLTLNHSYSQQTCSPTRAALLTGRYPHTIGMQEGRMHGTTLRWLNASLRLMPDVLGDLGYKTHAVGKWHLGFCHWKLTPRYRGFDTFYGFFTGANGYFTHSGSGNKSFDFRDNGRIAWETEGHYSTELHTTRVQKIIKNRGDSPFFIYMAYQNAHDPWEAKQSYIDKYCSHVKNEERRIHCAMVAAMDESIGNITSTLDEEGITDNTILLYFSDNGGPFNSGASNWPLRGSKSSIWEGGVRSHTIFVWPRELERVNDTWDELIHVTDWFPTFVAAAKGEQERPNIFEALTVAAGDSLVDEGLCDSDQIKTDLDLDGFNQLYKLRKFLPSRRKKMVYNFIDRRDRAAVRIGDLKLCRGKPGAVTNSGWHPPPSLLEQGEVEETVDDIPYWQLFNVREDPYERNNLFNNASYNASIEELKTFLEKEEKRLVPFPSELFKEDTGQPRLYGDVVSPGWCCP